jgi:two-component system cell cycle response regulator DivK
MVFKSIRNYSWKGKTVLVVEDDPAAVFFLQEIFSPTGIRMLITETGESAVSLCRKNKDIDIVIMDMNLPEMDGYEATRRIKKIHKDIPIIAQTAYALSEDRGKCIKSGCDGYVAKPVNIFELLWKMDTLLG